MLNNMFYFYDQIFSMRCMFLKISLFFAEKIKNLDRLTTKLSKHEINHTTNRCPDL